MTNKHEISCPTCGKQKTWTTENIYRPFCSERCKLIDLGEWASEKYGIPDKPINQDDPSNNDENE